MRAGDRLFSGWAVALTLWYGVRFTLQSPEEGAFGLQAALAVGGPCKWAALVLATVFALRVRAALLPENPARAWWTLLGGSVGLWSTLR